MMYPLLGKVLIAVFHKDLFLDKLLFLVYKNDLPFYFKSLQVLLFADDTKLTAINSDVKDIKEDLCYLNFWLNANMLAINSTKNCTNEFKP